MRNADLTRYIIEENNKRLLVELGQKGRFLKPEMGVERFANHEHNEKSRLRGRGISLIEK